MNSRKECRKVVNDLLVFPSTTIGIERFDHGDFLFLFFFFFFLKSYAKHGLKFETEDSKEWSLIFFFPSPFGETLPKFDLLSGIQWSKVITFFLFFFFRKRKLGNTRVVHASLVSIIKNDGSL